MDPEADSSCLARATDELPLSPSLLEASDLLDMTPRDGLLQVGGHHRMLVLTLLLAGLAAWFQPISYKKFYPCIDGLKLANFKTNILPIL
jgi:hypothetical protein